MTEESVFTRNSPSWSVTPAMVEAFNKNGYLLVRKMLTAEEVQKINRTVAASKSIKDRAFRRNDGSSMAFVQTIWNHPGNDVAGVLARINRVAGTMEQLLGGDEIYHYHSKLSSKEANTGGGIAWHQDYGYWYKNGNMYPDMGTVLISIDDCTRENGCLQVLRGSHKMGRFDHVNVGQQLGADPERVEQAKKVLDHVYVEMKAGDMLFIHCNLLHASDHNTSPHRRYIFLSTFNKRSNDPYKEHHHPRYTPMTKLPDSALLECEVEENLDGKWFMTPVEDHSTDPMKAQ